MVTTVVIHSFHFIKANVELNPGPKSASTSNISICHWNLDSISAHNYTKLFLLKTCIAIHKFDNFLIRNIS